MAYLTYVGVEVEEGGGDSTGIYLNAYDFGETSLASRMVSCHQPLS